MEKFKVYILLFLCCLFPLSGSAQLIQFENRQMTIFTFDEFCKVFNGQQNEVSVLHKFPKIINLDRMKLVPFLFNPLDTIPAYARDQFASYVSQWDYKISMDSVQAVVDLVYTDQKDNKMTMTAIMRMERRDDGDIWVMKEIECPSLFLGDYSSIGLIGFSNSEVAFQEFGRNAGCSPTDIAGTDFKPDNVTLFLYLTANKLIKFHHSENVRYFVRLGDYMVKVSQIINKDTPTMGWLITGLSRNGELVFGDMR